MYLDVGRLDREIIELQRERLLAGKVMACCDEYDDNRWSNVNWIVEGRLYSAHRHHYFGGPWAESCQSVEEASHRKIIKSHSRRVHQILERWYWKYYLPPKMCVFWHILFLAKSGGSQQGGHYITERVVHRTARMVFGSPKRCCRRCAKDTWRGSSSRHCRDFEYTRREQRRQYSRRQLKLLKEGQKTLRECRKLLRHEGGRNVS